MDVPTLHLKPADGLLVRDPITLQALPPEGAEVPDSTYWHRRLAEGDVSLVQPAAEAASKTTPTKAKQ